MCLAGEHESCFVNISVVRIGLRVHLAAADLTAKETGNSTPKKGIPTLLTLAMFQICYLTLCGQNKQARTVRLSHLEAAARCG